MMKLNHLLRRLVALLLCACMLLGNVGGALSEVLGEKTSNVILPEEEYPVARTLSATAVDSANLSDYAKIKYRMLADSTGTPLPDVIQNGQSLFFQMYFNLIADEGSTGYRLAQAYQNGEVDSETVFMTDISFVHLVDNANYPKSPDAKDNIATSNSMKVFRWWVDESSQKVCLCFFDEILQEINENSVAV